MFLMVDNYDSFVYNLTAYFQELGEEIIVHRNDALTTAEIRAMDPKGIIISPGPKRPDEAGLSEEIVREFHGEIPILGVCLGHQVIGHVFGATVEKGTRPMHGKVTSIHHNGERLFHCVANPFNVTRYHSLVVKGETLPQDMIIDATSEDGAVMAISHTKEPVYGVQFHPEA
ncbi:MAG: aminodeoxychorismate/anthranilate synthase component II, partial [Bacillota bacterium]|nr:aminodeoxychorismate/anthranilate synthase component II [Bacillota bacterium]